MDGKNIIFQRLESHIGVMRKIAEDDNLQAVIEQVISAMIECFERGNSVYFCGNGGSAADAQHLAAEFSGKFYIDRQTLPSEALHCNTSYLTAVSNDYSFEIVYARLVEGFGKQGDILVGLSTSGNSPNIVGAFIAARKKGMATVAFTGESGGNMKNEADFLINIPSSDTPRIQEAHITIGHIICERVEAIIFGN
ncbi:MAG: SIS domain-containing protein [Prolixibacteraceae bacterium]|nr:SIS domain-containing protein [Prolixibacteraceae bacterium]